MAGANSIFYGEKLLTTANNDADNDREMIAALGLSVAGMDRADAAE
jgi:biotin synthase